MSRRFVNYANLLNISWNFDPTGPWSVCGWIYIDDITSAGSPNADVFYAEDAGDPGGPSAIRLGCSFSGGNPTLRFRAPETSINYTYTPAALDTWYHMALTYDGTTARAYVDGVQVTSATVTIGTVHNKMDLGNFTSSDLSAVEIAQVKIWEGYALSVGELADEMDYWTPQHGTGFVHAWWQLENAAPYVDEVGGYTLEEEVSGSYQSENGVQTVPGQLEPDSGDVVDVAGATSTAITLAAAPNLIRAGAGALSAAVTLAGVPNLVRAGAGALTATATLAGAASLTHNKAGALTATITLAAAPNLVKAGAGALSATLTMTGATGSIFNAAGALSAAVTLAGAPQVTKVAAGAMTATITLAGAGIAFPLSQPGWTNPPLGAATPHGPWVSGSA